MTDATENTWDWLDNKTPYRQTTVEVIPLGTDRELIVKQGGEYVTFKAE